MATGFGRKGTVDPEMAARRAAFIASERARAERDSEAEETAAPNRPYPSAKPAAKFVPDKSIGVAYICWVLFGGFSAHRFYLGYMNSAIMQAFLSIGGLILLFGGAADGSVGLFAFAGLMMFCGGIWVLVDAILIPGMAEKANARVTSRKAAYVFE